MVQNFYIDERWSTGDILKSGHDFDFDGQPIFSLACIGVDNTSALDNFISNLKPKCKAQGKEIKSTKAYKIIRNK